MLTNEQKLQNQQNFFELLSHLKVDLTEFSKYLLEVNYFEAPYTAHELAVRDHLPIRLVNQLLSRMVETFVLREVYQEGDEDKAYQPALDTHKISVSMVMDRIDMQGTEEFLQAPSEDMQAFWGHFLVLKEKDHELNNILVSEL